MKSFACLAVLLCSIFSMGHAARERPTVTFPCWRHGHLFPEAPLAIGPLAKMIKADPQNSPLKGPQVIDELTNCDGPNKCFKVPSETAKFISRITQWYYMLSDQHTARVFMDLNHVNYQSCSKDALKKKVEFCRGLDMGEKLSLKRNLFVYCRQSVRATAHYCIFNRDDVEKLGFNRGRYMDQLQDEWEKDDPSEYELATSDKTIPDTLGDFIVDY